MSKLSLGPVGIALNVSADGRYLTEAAELEDLGIATLWLPGGQIDTLDRIGAIVRATTSVPVASAIPGGSSTGPAEVADRYAGLQASAPGRFLAGLRLHGHRHRQPQRPARRRPGDLGSAGTITARIREHLRRRGRPGRAHHPELRRHPRLTDVARELAAEFPEDSGWPRVSRVKMP